MTARAEMISINSIEGSVLILITRDKDVVVERKGELVAVLFGIEIIFNAGEHRIVMDAINKTFIASNVLTESRRIYSFTIFVNPCEGVAPHILAFIGIIPPIS